MKITFVATFQRGNSSNLIAAITKITWTTWANKKEVMNVENLFGFET